jgi:glycosyltransferase involved in cell wall biosynthesis
MGNMKNSEILDYFLQSPVDIFLNASRSEGIPVSIMEAMSCGIPAIAPDVGGIKELVSEGMGVLMSKDPTVAEIAEHVRRYACEAKTAATREAVRQVIVSEFDAGTNYSAFIAKIDDLASPNDPSGS